MSTRKPRYADIFAGHAEGAAMAEHANVLWATYKADLEGRGLFNAARGLTLDRLVRYRVEHDHYHPIVTAEGPVTIGPNGGDVANMKWAMVQKLADRLDKLEKALALTPEAVGDKPQGRTFEGGKKAGADAYLGAH